jgi:hypothetical protein
VLTFYNPRVQVYADSPDTDYRRAHIQLKRGAVYRLYGNVPSSACRTCRRAPTVPCIDPGCWCECAPATLYYGVQLYRAKGETGKNMSDEEIPRRPNGDFELYLTALTAEELPVRLTPIHTQRQSKRKPPTHPPTPTPTPTHTHT